MHSVMYAPSKVRTVHEQPAWDLRGLTGDAVEQSDNPSAAEVDRVHALLVESLSRMYDEHKHLVPGWVNRPLHII